MEILRVPFETYRERGGRVEEYMRVLTAALGAGAKAGLKPDDTDEIGDMLDRLKAEKQRA